MEKVEANPELAWGGIGGSGKHAGDAIAELVSRPETAELMKRLPQVAWGGIGGSGKHPSEIIPEVTGKGTKKE